MKTLTKAFLASSILLVTAVPAYADHNERNGGILDRMERQHSRIEQGVDTGRLTRKEAKELKKNLHRSRHLFRDFSEDGYLSKKERRTLDRHLDRVSERIWELKHNKRSRHSKPDHRYGYNWHDEAGWSRHHHSHGW
jgi:septal ring factor EnvC (AmiA/AmiB activator)